MKEQVYYILIADDDPDDREMLAERILQHHPGAAFKFFKDGSDVLEFLEGCKPVQLPSLLILDYKMPILTGEEVLKAIQGDPRYAHIPKIVWSTSGNAAYVDQCMAYGANRYFTKPNNMSELDCIIRHIAAVYVSVLSGGGAGSA